MTSERKEKRKVVLLGPLARILAFRGCGVSYIKHKDLKEGTSFSPEVMDIVLSCFSLPLRTVSFLVRRFKYKKEVYKKTDQDDSYGSHKRSKSSDPQSGILQQK